jgi:hypothetical protein
MNENYQITEAPMEQKDKNKLRNGLLLMPIFYVLWGVIAYFLYNNGFILWNSSGLNIFLAFSVIFLGIITWISRATFLDWKSDVKKIIKGVITRKEHQVSGGTDSGLHRGGKSRSKHTYNLYFGNYILEIKAHHYKKVNEGDLVEYHYGIHTQNIIQDIILKKNV